MSEEFSYGRTVKPYPPYNVSTDLEDTTPEHIATGYSNLTPWANSPNFDEVNENSVRGNLYVTIRRMY